MSRPRAYLRLVDRPDLPPLPSGDPADPAIWALMVGLALGDGRVTSDERALLKRIRPDLHEEGLDEWVHRTAAAGIDWDGIKAVATSDDVALDILRLAARMVALDGDIADAELGRMGELARVLGLPEGSPRGVLREVVAEGGPVDVATVKEALRNMWWDVLLPSRDPLESDLGDGLPPGAQLLCSIRLRDEEVAALCVEGLLARWDDGPAFVAWDQIAAYTRVPVPGATFHLRTKGTATQPSRDHTMTDARLRDVGALLDLVHGRQPHVLDEE